jgi:uncharacterized protein YcbK (DUF882 family)
VSLACAVRCCLFVLGLVVVPAAARADDADCTGRREVQDGESLWSIARDCGISVAALRRANDLDEDAGIRPGQRLRIPAPRAPAPGDERASAATGNDGAASRSGSGIRVELRAGQTLSDLAHEHGVSVRAIQRANDIDDPDLVEAGRRLLIPDDDGSAQRGTRAASNPITIHRNHTDEEETVRLFDTRGRVRSSAHRTVNHLLRHEPSGRTLRIAPELLQLLQRVADRWPGRRILVQSGVRPLVERPGREPGNHMRGRAVDFAVDGVSNRELRDFCRTLPNAGVGYYPNSSFVHLDTRDRSTFWVDLSGPGEPADYVDDPEGWVEAEEEEPAGETEPPAEAAPAAETTPPTESAPPTESTPPAEAVPTAPSDPAAPAEPATPEGVDAEARSE